VKRIQFQVVIFRGEGWHVYHQYKASPPYANYGAWANYHMLKDDYPVVLVMDGTWYYSNEAADRELVLGNYVPQVTEGYGTREVQERMMRNG
jgi:hypothetical protein